MNEADTKALAARIDETATNLRELAHQLPDMYRYAILRAAQTVLDIVEDYVKSQPD